jgi:hypothetical protein
MQYRSLRLLLLPLLASLGACSSDPVDLGRDNPKVLGATLSDYAGTWDGFAEAFEFSDGTDAVHLVLDGDGNGELWLGEADPLPAPEADRGYPPGTRALGLVDSAEGAVAGFGYPIVDGAVEDNRLRLNSSKGELYREWCDLQTPHVVQNATPSYYACLPFAGFGTTDNGECILGESLENVIDCGLPACLTRCECNEDDCAVSPHLLSPDIRVDATLEGDGDSFVGTLVLGPERINVRLTRM